MESIQWKVINGRIDFECGLGFRSYTYDEAMLKSDKSIKNGKISFDMILDTYNSDKKMIFTVSLVNDVWKEQLSILFYSDGNIEIYEFKNGLNKQLASLNNRIYEGIEMSITRNNNKRIICNIIIEICGSVINIARNGIVILNAYKTTCYPAQINANFEGEGFSSVKNFTVNNIKLKAFIIMEFSETFNKIYTKIIRPACEEQDILCFRVDEIYYPGKITSDIFESIKEADIIIAEITPNNANVFFELGYAAALDKQIIPLVDGGKRDKLPLDVHDIRTIFYENSEKGINIAIKKLSDFLMGIKERTFRGSVYRSILLHEHERM